MTEKFIDGLAQHGPGGIMATLAILALVAIWRYFTRLNQKIIDDNRLEMSKAREEFLVRTDKFTDVLSESNTTNRMHHELLRETKAIMTQVNLNMIELKSRQQQ